VSKAKTHSHEPSKLRNVLALIFGIIGIGIPFVCIIAVVLGSEDRNYDSCAHTGFVLGIIGCVITLIGGISMLSFVH
jgi:hypothetical protein